MTSERSKRIYGVAPYFFSKLVAEVPLAVGLSGLFGGLLYPMVGFQRKARKFLNFLAISTLQSFTATALGMLVGAAAPSSDAALAMFPPLVVLMVIFNGFNISDKSTPRLLKWVPKVSLIRWGFEGLAINEFRGLSFAQGMLRPFFFYFLAPKEGEREREACAWKPRHAKRCSEVVENPCVK